MPYLFLSIKKPQIKRLEVFLGVSSLLVRLEKNLRPNYPLANKDNKDSSNRLNVIFIINNFSFKLNLSHYIIKTILNQEIKYE